jgi:hypothetical protein
MTQGEGEFRMLAPASDEGPGMGAFRVPDGVDPSTIPDRLKAALAAAFEENTEATPDQPVDLAADIERLADMCGRYVQHYGLNQLEGAPFHVGQLVTPIKNCGTRGAGQPHVVLEVIACEPNFQQSDDVAPYSNGWGNRRNIRVGAIMRKPGQTTFTSYWVEGYEFEEFQQP